MLNSPGRISWAIGWLAREDKKSFNSVPQFIHQCSYIFSIVKQLAAADF